MSASTVTEAAEAVEAPVVPAPRKKWNVLVWFAYGWLALLVLLAAFAAVLPIASYAEPIGAPRLPPQFGDINLILGTDTIGRSVLSRVINGAQVSLLVGVGAGLSGFVVGSLMGLLAGYYGGRTNRAVTLIADAMLAFPSIILLLALASIFGPSLPVIFVGLAIVTVPTFTRIARANTIGWGSRDFVRAARNMGAGNVRILFQEILPNVLPALAAYLPIMIAALIVAEGSLSFLGLGIPPPTPSWGGMINAGKDLILRAPFLVFVPAAVIFLTVFSFNQVGDDLRRRFDRTLHD